MNLLKQIFRDRIWQKKKSSGRHPVLFDMKTSRELSSRLKVQNVKKWHSSKLESIWEGKLVALQEEVKLQVFKVISKISFWVWIFIKGKLYQREKGETLYVDFRFSIYSMKNFKGRKSESKRGLLHCYIWSGNLIIWKSETFEFCGKVVLKCL